MKLLAIVAKNLKLLLRSKGAALVAILGPLLIIALVGLALNNTQRLEVAVGLVVPESTDLAMQYIGGLVSDKYALTNFSSAQACVQGIRQGTTHTCVVFPPNFTVADDRTNELVIYIDTSRQNLVYAVINSLSSNVRSTSYDLSTDLAGTVLGGLFGARATLDEQAGSLGLARAASDAAAESAAQLQDRVRAIDLEYRPVNVSSVDARVTALRAAASGLRERGLALVRAGKLFAQLVEANSSVDTGDFRADLDTLEEAMDAQYNLSAGEVALLDAHLAAIQADVDALSQKVGAAKAEHALLAAGLEGLLAALSGAREDLSAVKGALEAQRDGIDGIQVTNAQSIVLPVTTRVEPVVSEHTRLGFLFPYLLGLLIMFVGILLPATLIVLEQSSQAFFRTFTTPTRSPYHIAATFLTALLLLAFQVAVFLGLASYFLPGLLVHNVFLTALGLGLAMGVFVLLGMAIGYAFGSQEAVTLISISVGSVLLLLSNLVLPLETFGGALRRLAAYNPYVLATDLLRQAILFASPWQDRAVLRGLGLLFLYAAAFGVLVIVIHKAATLRFFRKRPAGAALPRGVAPAERALVLNDATVIQDKDDLLDALKTMSDTAFSDHCYENRDEFTLWVRDALGDRQLAARMAHKSRAGMVAVLEEHLARERRDFARRFRKNPEGGASNYY